MKLLIYTGGTMLLPGCRYRILNFLPYLKQGGIEYKVIDGINGKLARKAIKLSALPPLLKIQYLLEMLTQLKRSARELLRNIYDYDVLFLYNSHLDKPTCNAIEKSGIKVIYDLDDALFVPESSAIGERIKHWFKYNRLINTVKLADMATAENDYVCRFLKRHVNDVRVIIGSVDFKAYDGLNKKESDVINLGRIGSPSTICYLNEIMPVLEELAGEYKFNLVNICESRLESKIVNTINYRWALENEVELVNQIDIGLTPMPDGEWTNGKVSVKTLQYMAASIPSLISYTPTNYEVFKAIPGVFLCRNAEDWEQTLIALMKDKNLRRESGRQAYEYGLKHFSVQANLPKLKKAMEDLCARNKNNRQNGSSGILAAMSSLAIGTSLPIVDEVVEARVTI